MRRDTALGSINCVLPGETGLVRTDSVSRKKESVVIAPFSALRSTGCSSVAARSSAANRMDINAPMRQHTFPEKTGAVLISVFARRISKARGDSSFAQPT